MTVLCLFLVGFSMLITAMNTPFYELIPEVATSIIILIHLFNDFIGLQEDQDNNVDDKCAPTATNNGVTGKRGLKRTEGFLD